MFADALSPVGVAPPGNPVAEADVDIEKTQLLFRNTGMAQAVVVINAGVLVFSLGGLHPPAWALAWWALMAVVAAIRYGLARRFLAGVPTPASAAGWRKGAIVGALVAGLVTALGGAAMMVADPGQTRLFTAMVVAGNAAGAIPILSSVPPAYRAYTVPVLSSVILTALFDPHGVRDQLLVLVATLYLGAVLRSAHYFHDNLDRSIRLALHMRQVAEDLEQARQREQQAATLERQMHREQRQFVATISHELRTPLAVISVAMQNLVLLNAGSLEPSARVRVAKAQAAIGRLTTIVDECLTPERLGVRDGPLSLKDVPVRDLLADAASVAQMYAEDHRVDIECDPALTAWCDAELLRLALRTLADNAVKYTPAGTTVILRATAGADGIRIEVADDGPGIPGEELPHVFEKYFRGRTAVTHAGTGLGLPLARHVIAQMGGTVAVDSTPRHGTVFTIALPSPGTADVSA